MDGHPLELPPVYPCSQGAPIVFAVPLGFLRFNEKAHATVYCVRCPVHRLMIWTAPQKKAVSSLFSHGLKIAAVFCRFSRTRSCPEDRSRRSRPRWCADASLRRGTYPIRTVIRFSRFRCCYKNSLAKKCALSRISKRSEKSAKQGGFPRLETERRRGTPCR